MFSFLSLQFQLSRSLKMTLIKGVSFSSPTDVESHNPPPLWGQSPRLHLFPSPIDVGPSQSTLLRGPASLLAHRLVFNLLRGSASSLAHCPVSGSDTICNSSSPLLVYIVLFGLSLLDFPSRFLKRVC